MAINNITPSLSNYIGNESVKRIINDNIIIAKRRSTAFPHTMIIGASGYGKTTLAYAIAHELNTPLIEINCAGLTNGTGGLISVLMKAPNNSIVLFDEIHSLPLNIIESILYRFMDENVIHLKYPDGNIEVFKINKNITIMGATTAPDQLPAPLLNRYQLTLKLKSYSLTEMCSILKLNIKNEVQIDDDALELIVSATRYVPRLAVQYSNLIKNYAYQHNVDHLSSNDIEKALKSWGIDENGLNDEDREYISLIYNTFNNNPVGLKTLKSMLNMSEAQLIDLENHLITEGYIIRSSRGRMLKAKGLTIAMSME